MSKYNPELAKIALEMIKRASHEKEAFVPLPAGQDQAMPAQQAPPGGDPSQGGAPPAGGDPSQGAGGPPPGGDPSQGGGDPSQGGAPPAPQGGGGAPMNVNPGDLQYMIRSELEAAQDKPKKQSADERITALEGAFLRLLQYMGLIPKQTTDISAGIEQADQAEQGGAGGPPPPAGAAMAGGGGAPPPDMGGMSGQPSDQPLSAAGPDPSGGAPMPKTASHSPFSGLAAAAARLGGAKFNSK